MAKGILVDGDKIRRRRQQLAISAATLKERSALSLRTIARAEASEAVTAWTLDLLAEGLETDPQDLLLEPQPQEAETEPPTGETVRIGLVVNAMIERYALSHLRNLLLEMAAQLEKREREFGVEPQGIRQGSVIVDVQMTIDQLDAIVDAFNEGSFDNVGLIGFSDIEFDRTSDMPERLWNIILKIERTRNRNPINVTSRSH